MVAKQSVTQARINFRYSTMIFIVCDTPVQKKKRRIVFSLNRKFTGSQILRRRELPDFVSRYFCLLLRSLSGIVISIGFNSSAGRRQDFRKCSESFRLVAFCRVWRLISPGNFCNSRTISGARNLIRASRIASSG